MICEWFARCTNQADGVVLHPILGEVPCCQRCAEKCGLDLRHPNLLGRPLRRSGCYGCSEPERCGIRPGDPCDGSAVDDHQSGDLSRAACGCDLTGELPPAAHIVDGHDDTQSGDPS